MQTMIFKRCARPLAQYCSALTLGLALLLSATLAAAGVVGEVEFSRGVGMAYVEGQTPRMMGKGLVLNEGDRLSTAAGGIAIITLSDGTRMTLRPLTELVIKTYRFKDGASNNSMMIELLQGGFRAITGQIPKNDPEAAKVVTHLGTISIRGTDFDARICAADCKAESGKIPEKPRPNAVQASAKLVSARGDIAAVDAAGQRRRLVVGASVYPGDTVQTGADATTVLAFRDDSRLTLGAGTQFRVDSYVFDDKKPSEGRSLLSLARGSMRAVTGLIGREKKENVGYVTPTATIGIRGTGLDMDCTVADACSFFTWQGSIAVTQHGQTTVRILNVGEGLFVSLVEVRPLHAPTLEDLQRPDLVTVDTKQLFSLSTVGDDREGLYVLVRDGHVELSTGTDILYLGRGETGFAGTNGEAWRPLLLPLFIEFDQIPLPSSINPLLLTLLNENRIRAAELCK